MANIIVAFDVSQPNELHRLLDNFSEPIYVKIGMEIFYQFGREIVHEIKKRGHKVFLDLKLHDIPNTVYHGIKSLASLNVDIINVHAGGGKVMMEAAMKAIKEVSPNTLVIAVTLLTSLDQETVNSELCINQSIQETALHYAKNALKAGLDGVVCSVWEVEEIKRHCGEKFICITPGISLSNTVANYDQKRVATPEDARRVGSDFVVIGRAITKSENPYQTFQSIKEVLENEK